MDPLFRVIHWSQNFANKVTGISTPLIGISWNPEKIDFQIARELMLFLEDRRVLFGRHMEEDFGYAEKSILIIRERLTNDIERLNPSSPLVKSLRSMRAACRLCLDRLQHLGVAPKYPQDRTAWIETIQNFRWVFGYYLTQIFIKFNLNPDDCDIVKMLPDLKQLDESQATKLSKLLAEVEY